MVQPIIYNYPCKGKQPSSFQPTDYGSIASKLAICMNKEDMGRMKLRKGFVFVVVTMLLIMGLALGMASTVSSQSEENVSVSEESYVTLESEYVQKLRTILNEEGYENCGINLTRVVDGEGVRAYSIVLHHKYLDKLGEEELQELFGELAGSAFHFSNCSFAFMVD